ncbi:hypothetical protein GCM10011583_24010 [Streptomyces camponoticapitis]|uniref:Uncharacterized protein n=1 Tax=Streptomyces camponoticapitis TaxID=1616125 RepID=A0ABQ2E3E6_9ACTN|nr:hypothetical protein GCM10011583_24010 [Streptomyces camponoticapitis]
MHDLCSQPLPPHSGDSVIGGGRETESGSGLRREAPRPRRRFGQAEAALYVGGEKHLPAQLLLQMPGPQRRRFVVHPGDRELLRIQALDRLEGEERRPDRRPGRLLGAASGRLNALTATLPRAARVA